MSKKENTKKIKELKEIIGAAHRQNREEQKAQQGGSLPFQHKNIEEVKHKNPKNERRKGKNISRSIMREYE